MRSKVFTLAIAVPALLLGIACTNQKQTSYKDSVNDGPGAGRPSRTSM